MKSAASSQHNVKVENDGTSGNSASGSIKSSHVEPQGDLSDDEGSVKLASGIIKSFRAAAVKGKSVKSVVSHHSANADVESSVIK